jgi:hypothetical protein
MKRQLALALEQTVIEDQILPIEFMQNLATTFCEVAHEYVTADKLLLNSPNDQVLVVCNGASWF